MGAWVNGHFAKESGCVQGSPVRIRYRAAAGGRWLLLSVQGALTQILLSVEGKCLRCSISSLMAESGHRLLCHQDLELGWQPLNQRRRNTHLTLLYKSMHGSASVPTDHLRQPSRHTRQYGTDTFIPLSSRTNA